MRWSIWNRILEKIRIRNMEITNKNFKDKLPLVEAAINDAIFVAIDGEFTGLNAYKGISAFDTPCDRYEKLQESSKQFLLIQFGLCTFHYNKEKDQYTNQAFNFYVWPKPYQRSAPDLRFMCQTSSMDFLSSQNFDFNKLFKEGVSYLLPSEEKRLRETIKEKQASRKFNSSFSSPHTPSGSTEIPVPADQKEFIEAILDKIQTFSSSTTDDTLDLPRCNAFQRRLVYQAVKQKYKDLLMETIEIKNSRDRIIRVERVTEFEMKKREQEKNNAEFEALDEAIGFSRVILKLAQSEKLIVGHNMILDICHTLNQFVEILPENYLDFKALCQRTFPKILDTKLMASTYPFKDEISNSSLDGLKTTVSELPYELPDVKPASVGCGYGQDCEKYHEAGYDAYITGLCFIAMSNRMGKLSQDKSTKHPKFQTHRVLPDSHLISPFFNKMYLMKISDIPYMNLSGEDLEPNRDHVFHVTFPPEWKTGDLLNLFSPFGPIHIVWLSDVTAFVGVNNKKNAITVMNSLNVSQTYSVIPYQQFRSFQKSRNSTGITPMVESSLSGVFTSPKRNFFSTPKSGDKKEDKRPTRLPVEGKKRSPSPSREPYKRPRSVNEETSPVKRFEEPEWD